MVTLTKNRVRVKKMSYNNNDNNNNNNKKFIINQLMWLGISLGISIVISMLVPFPISLVTIIGVFILLNFYMRKRMMKRMGIGGSGRGGIGMFGSLSSSTMFGDSSLKYYCMTCGTPHKQIACPKCGSKMKRVGS
jgi:hypothetical protein